MVGEKGFLKDKRGKGWLLAAGMLLMLVVQLPFLVLGTDSVVPWHDQLDGELIAYLYQAKYLFSGESVIPEFMGGAAKTALFPPAPLAVLFFRFLSPFAAYLLLQTIGQVTAYASMFLLADRLTGNGIVSAVTACLYAFLPFLPLYGLSQYGIPLLMFCGYLLYRGEHRGAALGGVALYALLSSLVLCGFACILLWLAAVVILGIRKRLKGHGFAAAGLGVLVVVYGLENLPLVFQLLGMGQAGKSHKLEYRLAGADFFPTLLQYLGYNAEHSEDFHIWIIGLAAAALAVLAVWRGKAKPEALGLGRRMLAGGAVILLLCLIAAVWESRAGAVIRGHLGTLGTIQINRVLWLAPAFWYGEMALAFQVLWSFRGRLRRVLPAVLLAFSLWMGANVLRASLVKPCAQAMLQESYGALSWSDYYAAGVMEQVEQYLRETRGREKTDYRVASLGIDPAAALYHGFYCVDGYSNNYDLEYKRAFRRVIAPELERNDWIREYYDDWGNRCYLFSAEIPGYYTVEKRGFWYEDLRIDTGALKELGCDYILSAAYVRNAEEENLRLLREEPFETPDSYYGIYLYEICPNEAISH